MYFTLGYLAGIATIIVILLLDIYLWLHRGSLTERAISLVQNKAGPKAQIIAAPSPQQQAIANLPKDKEIKFEIND